MSAPTHLSEDQAFPNSTSVGPEGKRPAEKPVPSEDGPRSPLRVSVVVCTRARPDKLTSLLRSLANVRRPDSVELEVVVVNNGSGEETPRVVERIGRDSGLELRLLADPGAVVAAARNRAIRESRGEIVALVDDDCLVAPTWLAQIGREFRPSSNVDVLGGRVELYDRRDRPVTVRTDRKRKRFEPTELFSSLPGCNLCFRRIVWEEIGGFDERFGPGTGLRAAEDSDLLFRAYRAGFRMVYSPDLLVYHHHGRRTDDDVSELEQRYLVGRGGFYAKHVLSGDGEAARLAWWELGRLLRTMVGKWRAGEWPTREIGRLRGLARGAVRWLETAGIRRGRTPA